MLKSSSQHCFQMGHSRNTLHHPKLAKPSSLFSCGPLCCPQAPCCEPLSSAVGFLTLVVVSDGQERENSCLPPFPAYLLTFADHGIRLLQSLHIPAYQFTNTSIIFIIFHIIRYDSPCSSKIPPACCLQHFLNSKRLVQILSINPSHPSHPL